MKNKNNSNELILEKIMKLLYVVIGMVAVAIIIGIINTANISSISSGNTTNNNNTEETNTEYDVSMFNEVDFTGLKNLLTADGTHVIYIGRATCGYCVEFLPTMQQAQSDYGFTTDYFDISTVIDFANNSILDQTAYDYIVGLNDFMKENFGSTPMVIIYKDGKYKNGTVGYTDYATYAKFLTDNGISK